MAHPPSATLTVGARLGESVREPLGSHRSLRTTPSELPAERAGEALRHRVREQLAGLPLGREIAHIEAPALPLESEAGIAVDVVDGRWRLVIGPARIVVTRGRREIQP